MYLKEEYGVTFPLFELGPLAEQFYLVSNRRGKLGAICMCYPGVLESLSQRFEASLYVIPSSIHECMVIPDYDVFPEECLSDMVRDVNEKTVKPQEILSDHVYYYHRESGELTLWKPQVIGNVSCRLPRLFVVRVSGADIGHRNRVKREEQAVSCVGIETRLGNGIRDCGDVGWLVVVVLHEA